MSRVALASLLLLLAWIGSCQSRNVAHYNNGGRCQASSHSVHRKGCYECERAIDGSIEPVVSEWATKGQGVGSWLQISFAERYQVKEARFMQRLAAGEQSKTIKLTFDQHQPKYVTLTKNNGKNWLDTSVRRWEAVRFESPICASSVRIDVMSVYTSNNNGFMEVEFYADKRCTSKCDPGSTSCPTEDLEEDAPAPPVKENWLQVHDQLPVA